jgi:hypothetical protein
MDPDALVSVCTLTEPTRAELIRAELDAEGIDCVVSGDNQAGLAGVLRIDVMVNARDADRAREFIADHEGRGDDADWGPDDEWSADDE